jgi:hypothetical protein
LTAAAAAEPENQATTDSFLSALVRANDLSAERLLAAQEMAQGHRWVGGVRDDYGIHTAGGTAGLIKTLVAAAGSSSSIYARSPLVPERLLAATRYLLASQHEDGTIDLHTTNFHSPPDTAFVLEPVCAALAVIRSQQDGPMTPETVENLDRFIRRAGDSLAVGGIHTPNHRWVVCSALARVNSLFPDPRYARRIDEWLAEGIDIDVDGQFTERSTSIYSPTVDRALLTAARLLNRPALLDPVRRNLEMTLYFLHEGGEVATEVSRRQDQYQKGFITPYYLPYRYLALKDRHGVFASVARLIETSFASNLGGELIYFLEDRTLGSELPAPTALPDDFERIFPNSAVARLRRGRVSATILAQNSTFFAFRSGAAVLEGLRFASAFFGKGQFRGERLESESGRYRLVQELTGPYYQPLPKELRQPDGVWTGTQGRPTSEVQTLTSQVYIRESPRKGAFQLEMSIEGAERVPVAVELGWRKGGELSGVVPVPGMPDGFFLKDGFGEYKADGQTIRFGPGRHEHGWTQLRGADPKLPSLSVYLTGFTPFRGTLEISSSRTSF